MSWAAAVRTALVCLILIVLHYTLVPLLSWRAAIDFLLIALVFGAVRMRPAGGAVFGFIIGMATDSMAGSFCPVVLAGKNVGFGSTCFKSDILVDILDLNAVCLIVVYVTYYIWPL